MEYKKTVTIEPLPTSTDIKEWNKLKCFRQSFRMTKHLDLSHLNIGDLASAIRQIGEPTIVLIKVKDFNTLYSEYSYTIRMLFGMKKYSKLTELNYNGNSYYFHGNWPFILSDLWPVGISLSDTDEEKIYIGVGFRFETNDTYCYKFGSKEITEENDEQGVLLISSGSMVYRRNL